MRYAGVWGGLFGVVINLPFAVAGYWFNVLSLGICLGIAVTSLFNALVWR